jgi:uncharacterized protein GlcG (DUF336 family)
MRGHAATGGRIGTPPHPYGQGAIYVSAVALAEADRIIAAAQREADQRGVAVVVVVVDHTGTPVSLARSDGVAPPAVDVAIGKAATSAALGVPSGALQTAVAPGGPLYGLLEAARNSRPLVVLPGGIPLPDGLGGVGVGGSPDPQTDHDVALAAARAIATS